MTTLVDQSAAVRVLQPEALTDREKVEAFEAIAGLALRCGWQYEPQARALGLYTYIAGLVFELEGLRRL